MNNLSISLTQYFRNFLPIYILLTFLVAGEKEQLVTFESDEMSITAELVADGLGVPWALTFLNPDEILFTERDGDMGILNPKTSKIIWLEGVPEIRQDGQGGLMDAAVRPGHQSGDWIYFTYIKETKNGMVTALARAHRLGNYIVGWQDMLVTKSATNTGRHFGSRITFDNDGHLYFTVGERGHRPNAQDLTTHAGSILRLNLDGSVPKDNPFINVDNTLPEIWSYGHRNPQGIVYDSQHDRLWSIEHGPRGGDEINLILVGRNYGWPIVSYGKEYWGPISVGEGTEKDGMEPPVKVYIPSIAPGSLMLYGGDAFPSWKGNLFAGSLILTHLNRIILNESGKAVNEERLLLKLEERIRAIVESPEGWIYLSTDSGKIIRLRPSNTNFQNSGNK